MTLGGSASDVMVYDSQGTACIEDKLLAEVLLKCIICWWWSNTSREC